MRKSKDVKISVVVPAYNEEKYIGGLLQSLSSQQCSVGYEVIVVNNASFDRTAEVALSFGVKVLDEPKKGYSYPVIRGCRAAEGEIICITDADVRVPGDWLENIWGVFRQRPEMVALGGIFYYYDGPPWINLVMKVVYEISPRLVISELNGTNLFFRREAYEKVGGFEEGVNLSSETLLVRKLKEVGRVVLNKEIVVETSFRRFRGMTQFLVEIGKRIVNAMTIKVFKRVIFNTFEDVR